MASQREGLALDRTTHPTGRQQLNQFIDGLHFHRQRSACRATIQMTLNNGFFLNRQSPQQVGSQQFIFGMWIFARHDFASTKSADSARAARFLFVPKQDVGKNGKYANNFPLKSEIFETRHTVGQIKASQA